MVAWRNLAIGWRIDGTLDPQTGQLALEHVTRRQEALRSCLGDIRGKVVQLIAPRFDPALEVVDIRRFRGHARGRTLRRSVLERLSSPFHLTRPPLWRPALLRLGSADQVLLLVVSHTIWDGYSTALFAREFSHACAVIACGRSPLDELPMQLGDLAHWESTVRDSRAEGFWAEAVRETPRHVPLSIDRARATTRRYAGHDLPLAPMPSWVGAALSKLARDSGTTVAVTLTAAFALLLLEGRDQTELVIGVDEANRDRRETMPVIGNLLNVIPLRVIVRPGSTFREVVASTGRRWTNAYEHRMPLRRIAELHEDATRGLRPTALYEVTLNVRPYDVRVLDTPGGLRSPITLRPWHPAREWANFPVASVWWRAHLDLSLDLHACGRLTGEISYNREAIDDRVAAGLTHRLKRLLRWVAHFPDHEIPSLGAFQR